MWVLCHKSLKSQGFTEEPRLCVLMMYQVKILNAMINPIFCTRP